VPPPSTTNSRPGRLLAALAVVLIIMLVSVLGGALGSPGKWHQRFQVGLGLDLSWGTQITLKAYEKGGKQPDSGAMTKARQIMLNRIDGSGFNNASVVQQGPDDIVVSVPHENAEKVQQLVGTTAVLSFRQVLLVSSNTVTPSTTPSASPSTSASPGSSPSPSTSSSAKASSSPSPSSGSGQAVGASVLSGSGAKTKPSPSTSASSSPSASNSPSPAASTSTGSGKPQNATTADGQGDPSALSAQTVKDFNKLDCAKSNWHALMYGSNPSYWPGPDDQMVVCYQGAKYALDKAVIQGTDMYSVSAQADTTAAGYLVTFNVRSPADTKLGALTTKMAGYYTDSTSNSEDAVIDTLAVVLDGQIQSNPVVQGAFSSSGQIQGPSGTGFSQSQADNLSNLLKYGALPLYFKTLDASSVSPQLGSAQLSAGIIAGIVGLILVIIYSFLYYRGLALVSISSLGIAAAITYLAVVLLSRYESFNLTLAGIAGLIVAIGITADSFVVYFERLRDEVREGRSLRAAVERGWARARRTILVSDTVSFLAALLLYIFAIGDVRGFAFTLGLTTLVDIVVVFLFTKPMVTLLARTKFYGRGHRLSGLDPERLGMRSPWRGSRAPVGSVSSTGSAGSTPANPKEA
jgi:preprotein translocase subunit SecD